LFSVLFRAAKKSRLFQIAAVVNLLCQGSLIASLFIGSWGSPSGIFPDTSAEYVSVGLYYLFNVLFLPAFVLLPIGLFEFVIRAAYGWFGKWD